MLPSKMLKTSSLMDYNFDVRVAQVALEQEIKDQKAAVQAANAKRRGR